MKEFFSLGLGLAIVLSAGLACAASDQGSPSGFQPAPIHVYRAQGDVRVSEHGGGSRQLSSGQVIRQGTTVTTAANSKAVLMLANGSSISLMPESSLVINEFQQVGNFDVRGSVMSEGKSAVPGEVVPMSAIAVEPSYSKTRIFLREGTMYVSVLKLRKKSYFYTATPVGVGEVLGTNWRQRSVSNPANNTASAQIAMQRGRMRFRPLSSRNNPNKPFVINNYEQYSINGRFANRQAFDSAFNMFSNGFAADMEIADLQMDMSISEDPIRDQEFDNDFAANLPPEASEQTNLVGEPLPPNHDTNIDTDPFFTGDQGIGNVGTLGAGAGGGGGGGGSGGDEPTPTPTPARPAS